MSPFDDRFAAGMREQLELRRARLAEGDKPIGWKVGFNAPAARANLGTDLPLVGFLTEKCCGGADCSGAAAAQPERKTA